MLKEQMEEAFKVSQKLINLKLLLKIYKKTDMQVTRVQQLSAQRYSYVECSYLFLSNEIRNETLVSVE